MKYKKFDKLVKAANNQLLIHTKDNQNYYIRLEKEVQYNLICVIATNEKGGAVEIIEYDNFDYCIVDGKKYK